MVLAYSPLLRPFLLVDELSSSTLRISLTRSSGRHGLVTNASQPARFAPSEIPASAWPGSATAGMDGARAAAFTRRVASQPSITGSDRSIRIVSGDLSAAFVS